ncbi:MAG: hypothetical protein ACTHNZ_19595 [Trinickia sp.]|uniref:hypothetical protein n=1 Tax=Trinickia sp. TaxID=2571163 RepID=UPI003F7E1CAD
MMGSLDQTDGGDDDAVEDVTIARGWARRLVEKSEGLTSSVHLPAEMLGCSSTLGAIDRMFTRFSTHELPRVRAWVDGGQRYTFTDALVSLGARADLTLEQRLALAAESPEFCATFNGLTGWCPQFAARMQQEMLSPLFDALGAAPACGTDFYAFFGNYGYTPFGVHDDLDHSLLWHLGPSSKIAYIWPRRRYIELTGGALSTTQFTSLLMHARRYVLRPGDLLFIPMGDFHVLRADRFSATLGLTIFPDDLVLECSEGLRLFAPDAPTFSSIREQSFTLQDLVELRRAAVRSNGFVITPPEMSTLAPMAVRETEILNGRLRIPVGYPLVSMRVACREALFVRRRVIWGRPNTLFSALCETLNGAEQVSFQTLRRHIAARFESVALVELLQSVSRLGGLAVEPL